MQIMKIGDLAKKTGLSVRTLHHYDEIDLLKPSGRTEGDHRVYHDQDIERLHQIISLKKLNLSLEEISSILKTGPTLSSILERHRDLLEEEIQEKQKIIARLTRTLELAKLNGGPTIESLLASIRELTLLEKVFSSNQLDGVFVARKSLGDEQVQLLVQELMSLVNAFKNEMIQNTPSNDPKIITMTKRWIDIRNVFTQGNFDISEESRQTLMNDPEIEKLYGINHELMGYIQKAADELKPQSI